MSNVVTNQSYRFKYDIDCPEHLSYLLIQSPQQAATNEFDSFNASVLDDYLYPTAPFGITNPIFQACEEGRAMAIHLDSLGFYVSDLDPKTWGVAYLYIDKFVLPALMEKAGCKTKQELYDSVKSFFVDTAGSYIPHALFDAIFAGYYDAARSLNGVSKPYHVLATASSLRTTNPETMYVVFASEEQIDDNMDNFRNADQTPVVKFHRYLNNGTRDIDSIREAVDEFFTKGVSELVSLSNSRVYREAYEEGIMVGLESQKLWQRKETAYLLNHYKGEQHNAFLAGVDLVYSGGCSTLFVEESEDL